VKAAPFYKNTKGFTLVEVIVVMAVFLAIIMIAAGSFNTIMTQSSKYSKSEESNIEGIIGLEVMRHDLEQMGFGLPWGWSKLESGTLVDSTIDYDEATNASAATMNDAPSNVPRAFAAVDAFGNYSTDYLAVKGSTVGRTQTSQRWTYIPFQNYSALPWESRPVSFPGNNPKPGDKIMLVNSNFNDLDGSKDRRLIVEPGDPEIFYLNFNNTGGIATQYLPPDDQQTYMVYGIDGTTNPRMPFNRADFFIKIPAGNASEGSLPPFCAPRTGVLYKATINHGNGAYNYIPLLDCVADMQVVLGWDTSDGGKSGAVDAYSSLPSSAGTVTAAGASAASIQGWLLDSKSLREHLKMVKVYILAQEGKRDPGYTSPVSSYVVGNAILGETSLTRQYNLAPSQMQYRWKLYQLIVRPKNLVSNQR
jgi:prepilin-type N-terminal cleavage/methylation domain-containing protein